MHEMAMAQEIINIVNTTLSDHPGKIATKVCVKIGEMAAVVPESLEFSYNALIQKTNLQKSHLEIEIIPITASCEKCHQEFDISDFEFFCPYCHSQQIRIKSGDELYISELEVE